MKSRNKNLSGMRCAGSRQPLLRAWAALWVAVLCPLAICAAVRPAVAAVDVPDPEITASTKIIADCVLEVTVTDEPRLSGNFSVGAAGAIHFTLTDDEGGNKVEWDVPVAGKTAEEARTAITASLKTYLHFPEVKISILSMPRVKVEITGPVRHVGMLNLPQKSRLSDALAQAGYGASADLTSIRILRSAKADDKTPAGPRTIPVNFAAFIQGESKDDPLLETNDRIIVPALPEKAPAQELKLVRIVGEVTREASIPLSPGMTVKDAFQRAGGLKETANRENIRVIRGSDGRIGEVEADKVEANDPIHNLVLGPGDLIIVGMRDRSMRFAVLGEVLEQKTIDWNPKEKITLLKALELAGGPTKNGDRQKGMLRKGYLITPNETREITFNIDNILKGKEPDWEIEPGDAILIPPKVRRPSAIQQLLPMILRFLPFGL